MTTVITAPDNTDVPGFKVYLAGAIDMGHAIDWQSTAIAGLADVSDLVVLNPRRAKFDDDTRDEQIRWELDALERADVILVWFPSDARAPIALLETGLYMSSGKLILGAGPRYWRRRNLELTADKYNVPVYSLLMETITATLHRVMEWKDGQD